MCPTVDTFGKVDIMSNSNLWPSKELVLPGVDNAKILGIVHAILGEYPDCREVGERGVGFGQAVQLGLFVIGNADLLGDFAEEGVLLLKISRFDAHLRLAVVQYWCATDANLPRMTQSMANDLLEELVVAILRK